MGKTMQVCVCARGWVGGGDIHQTDVNSIFNVISCKKREGSHEEIKIFMLGELGLLVPAADPAGLGCLLLLM